MTSELKFKFFESGVFKLLTPLQLQTQCSLIETQKSFMKESVLGFTFSFMKLAVV